MNVFEMLSFDFQEFVTSPAGILIIVGIICLLVGIVIFLKEGKKSAKPVEEEKAVEAQPTVEEVKAPEATPVAPVVEPVIVKATEDGVNEVPVPTVTDTLNIAEEKPAVVAPTEEIKVETLDAPVAPAVEPVPVAPVVEPVAPVVEPTPVAPAQPAPTVYGGVSPEVGNVTIEEKPREIYGGANPLENTAPIPTAEVNNAVQAAAPVVEPTPVAPVVAPVQPAPVVEPVAPAQPAAPVIEPPKEEIEKLEF